MAGVHLSPACLVSTLPSPGTLGSDLAVGDLEQLLPVSAFSVPIWKLVVVGQPRVLCLPPPTTPSHPCSL